MIIIKRFIAFFISIFLLVGVLPTAFAEASEVVLGNGAVFEAEQYLDYTVTKSDDTTETVTVSDESITEDGSYSGEAYLCADFGTSENPYVTKAETEIPFVTSATAEYKVSFYGKAAFSWSHMNSAVYLDDVKLFDIVRASANTESEWWEIATSVKLPAGTAHTLKLSFGVATSTTATCWAHWDYIKIEPVASYVELSETEETRIEAENYIVELGTSADDAEKVSAPIYVSKDSGGNKYATTREQKTGSGQHSYMEIKISVPETGNYDISLRMQEWQNASHYGLAINNKQATEISEFSTTRETAWTEINQRALLYRGENIVTLIGYHTNSGFSPLIVDYIEFNKVPDIEVSGRRYIEAEDHFTGGTVTACANASGGEVVKYASGEKPQIQVPVNIEESGYYEITFVAAASTGASKIDFTLNLASEFYLRSNNYETEGVVVNYPGLSGLTMKRYKVKAIWIDANDYTLGCEISAASNGTYTTCIDYIEIKPRGAEDLLSTEPLLIEFDEYAGSGVYDFDKGVTKDQAASGGKYVLNTWLTNGDPNITIPVKVDKSGFYNIRYALGTATSAQSWFSYVELKLGELTIGTNYETPVETLGYSSWGNQPVGLYEKEWVWLTAGEYDLTVKVHECRDNSGTSKYQYDFIEFVPSANGITIEDGLIRVHASYVVPKTGRVIMAAYNDNELVGCVDYDITGKLYADFVYLASGPVTKVKVFLWDSLENVCPLEMEKEFDILE